MAVGDEGYPSRRAVEDDRLNKAFVDFTEVFGVSAPVSTGEFLKDPNSLVGLLFNFFDVCAESESTIVPDSQEFN